MKQGKYGEELISEIILTINQTFKMAFHLKHTLEFSKVQMLPKQRALG